MNDATTWWGTHEVPTEGQLRLTLGALDLWVQHLPNEWRVARSHADDPLRDILDLSIGELEPLPEGLEQVRFATDRSDGAITLVPRAADRPMVVRPSAPLSLIADDSVSFFVSTPMWLALQVAGSTLGEVPTSRPNDTWFGETTRYGQLCYSGRTTARLRAEALPKRPGRVYTEVKVVNHAVDPLRIERVHLPLPHVPLGHAADGTLWTPPVTLVREGDRAHADLDVGKLGPGLTPIGDGPRTLGKPSIVVRALGALLS